MAAPATLKIQIIVDAVKAVSGMQRASAAVETTSTRMKGKLKSVGGAIAGAFAGKKILDFAKDSITAASDLSETMSKTQQIFGSSADAITAWSQDSSNALGLSQKDALDAADTFAIFGKSAGLTGSALTGFSTNLTGTAADFASFANTTPQEAIDAIGAALRGETEPIRKYGLMLNDAAIKNEAMRLGLIKTTKVPIDPSKRALAVKSLIGAFAKGQKITGDFARTSGGLANQQRIMAAKMTNLKASIGAQLLPVMLTAITAFQKMATFVRKNSDWLVPLASAIGVVVAAIKVATIVQRLFNITLLTNPIFLIVVAVVALGVALVVAYKKSAAFRNIVQAVFRAVAAAAQVLWAAIRLLVGYWILQFKLAIVIVRALLTAVRAAFRWIASAVSIVIGAFRSMVSGIKTALSVLFQVITAPYRLAWTWIANTLIPGILSWFKRLPGWIGSALSSIFTVMTAPYRLVWTWIAQTLIPGILGWFHRLPGWIGGALAPIYSTITAPFRAAWNWVANSLVPGIIGWIRSIPGKVASALAGLFNAIATPFRNAWDWVRDHVISPLRNAFAGIVGAISRAMSGVYNAIIAPFKAAWSYISRYVISPIRTGFDKVIGGMKSVWNGFARVWNSIQIKLPSWKMPVPPHKTIGGGTIGMPDLPLFATGAYVTRATAAVVGESGPEVVAPEPMLRRLIREELGRAGPSIVVNGALDPDAVARQIESLLARRARRVGGVARRGAPAGGLA